MDQSSAAQNRKSQRSNVLLAATLETNGASLPIKLRNLSPEGALVDGEPLPEAGSEVVFHRNELSLPGRVAWVHGNHAGIAFAKPLQPEEVLRNVSVPKQKQSEYYRRPGFKRELTEQEKRLVESWL
jgi:hypothetical protein